MKGFSLHFGLFIFANILPIGPEGPASPGKPGDPGINGLGVGSSPGSPVSPSGPEKSTLLLNNYFCKRNHFMSTYYFTTVLPETIVKNQAIL